MKVSFLFTFLYRKSKTKQESLLAQDMCCQLRFVLPEAAIRGVLCKKVFLEIWQNSQENTCVRVSFLIFFFYQGFLSRTLRRLTGQQGKGRDHLLFHSTPSTRSRTFRHLFATFMWDDYHVFLIAPLAFTRLLLDERFTTLSSYHLIDWWCDSKFFVCLRDDLILAFLLQQFETGNRWIGTRIDYHPCITSEPTDVVC